MLNILIIWSYKCLFIHTNHLYYFLKVYLAGAASLTFFNQTCSSLRNTRSKKEEIISMQEEAAAAGGEGGGGGGGEE